MSNRAGIIKCFFDAVPFVFCNLASCIFRGLPFILAFVFLKSYPHLFKDAASTQIYKIYEGFVPIVIGMFFILFFQWWIRYSAGLPVRITGFRMISVYLEFCLLIMLVVLSVFLLSMITVVADPLLQFQPISENTTVKVTLLLFLFSPLAFILWHFLFPMIALSQPIRPWRYLVASLRRYGSFMTLVAPFIIACLVISYVFDRLQIPPASLVLQNLFGLSEIVSEGINSAASFMAVFLFIAVLVSTAALFFKRNFEIDPKASYKWPWFPGDKKWSE